jgi:DNA-binding response OmpR family regulator
MEIMQITSPSPSRYQDAHLEVDFVRKSVTLDSRCLVLNRKEYELLSLLVDNAGEIIPRDVLLMRVWGYSNQIRTRTLDVHVCRLRLRLGSYSGQYLETIFGIGYRFKPIRTTHRFQLETPSSGLALTA